MSFPVRFILSRPGAKPEARKLESLDSLASVWKRHVKNGAVGIIHMPGEELPLDSLPRDWGGFSGRALVTEAFWAGLPRGRPDLGEKAAQIGGISLRAAPDPWPLGSLAPQGNWVPLFLAERPEFSDDFSRAGIDGDAAYLEREASLGFEARGAAGLWRFAFLLGSGAVADRGRNARIDRLAFALPPWILERPFSQLRLPPRASGAFQRRGLERVSDLFGISEHAISGPGSLGSKALGLLKEALFLELEKLPYSGPEHLAFGAALGGRTLFRMIDEDIGRLSETDRRIIEERTGLYQPRRWRRCLAESLGVSSWRVQHVERQVWKSMRQSVWMHCLFAKLDMILLRCGGCARVSDLPATDPFFAGFDRLEDVLPRVLDFLGSRLRVMDFPSGRHLCDLADGEWDAALERAGRLVRERIACAPPPEACRALVAGCFDGARRGLGELLWGAVEPLCHFLPDGSGSLGLCSFGQSLCSRYDSILEASSEPLHFEDLWKRSGCNWSLSRAKEVACGHLILLGHGAYGLERHLSFPAEKVGPLARGIESIVAEAPEKPQWHCAELLAGLRRLGLAGESMTKHEVNYVLSRAGGMRSLGRMVWCRKSSALSRRMKIHETVVSILRDEGKPLSLSEIKARISLSRGLDSSCRQIRVKPPLKRLAGGKWGLEGWAVD